MGHTDREIGLCLLFSNKSEVWYLLHSWLRGSDLLLENDCVERRTHACCSVWMCFYGPGPRPAFMSLLKSRSPFSPHVQWGTLLVCTSPWSTMGTTRGLFWGLGPLLSCPRSLRVPQVLQQALHHYALWYRGLNLSVCVCSAVINISIL